MRWFKALLCALVLAGLLGCPHAFMRRGTIDRAAEKDIRRWKEMGKCPPIETIEELCEAVDDPDCFKECR